MKTLHLILACTITSIVAGAPFAHATDHARTKASKSEVAGVGAGVAIGAAVGGPVGAIIGAAIGGHYGDTRHQAQAMQQLARASQAELDANRLALQDSMSEQGRLDLELLSAQSELDSLTQKIERLFVERALVDGIQFDVHFDTDDAALTESDRARLARLSQLLKAVPEAEVALHGFADSRGHVEHNETLSLDRAYSVADTLNALGVAQNQIKTYALGESQATYAGDDADGYSHDRRVSIRLQIPVGDDLLQESDNASAALESTPTGGGQ